MIIYLMFIAVAANHLGLVSAIEEKIDSDIPIVNCPKCLSFWSSLFYLLLDGSGLVYSLAASFFVSYLAIWTELAMGMLDHLYSMIYEKIYRDKTDTAATDAQDGDSDCAVSDV